MDGAALIQEEASGAGPATAVAEQQTGCGIAHVLKYSLQCVDIYLFVIRERLGILPQGAALCCDAMLCPL
jgi:hypothetical protein